MHWLHRFEVKSMWNMLDQHSGIHFTETSSQETSPTPSDMSIPPCTPSQILISAAPLSAFPDSLSLVCLPTYQLTFLLLLASPTPMSSSSPLFWTSTGLHPSLSPLAMGWRWCPLSATLPLLLRDKSSSAELTVSGHGHLQILMTSTEFVTAINFDHLINLEKHQRVQEVSFWLNVNHN